MSVEVLETGVDDCKTVDRLGLGVLEAELVISEPDGVGLGVEELDGVGVGVRVEELEGVAVRVDELGGAGRQRTRRLRRRRSFTQT